MSNWPSVTLIVLNYNTSHIVPDCIHALQALDYPTFNIILVDNASTDGSVGKLSQQFPMLTILANEQNRGFAAGNNTALRQLDSDFAVLVNPDVVVPPNWLKLFMTPLKQDATIGIAGCKLLYPDSSLIQHAGGFITLPQALPGHYGLREVDDGQFDVQREVDYVIGAAFAIRKTVVDAIGLMDEAFFLYFEETDYCYRAREAGFQVVYVPEAMAVHHESISVKRETAAYFKRMHQSRWRFILKHLSLDMILSQTIPAEKSWLATLPTFHRQTVADSYFQTRSQLAHMIQDYQSTAVHKDVKLLDSQIAQLIITARQTTIDVKSKQFWPDFKAAAPLQPSKFSSNAPLFGGFITSFRTWWNEVETRPYTQPILQQLHAWNQAVIQTLQEHQKSLARDEANLTQIANDIQQIRAEIVRVKKQLDLFEAQLER